MNPKVDAFIARTKDWQEEVKKLRAIALGCDLGEELKWGNPCYTLGESNIVLIHCFKEYCAFLFFKGALMKDPKGMLIQQTEKVQAARQLRFAGVKDIIGKEKALKAYIQEAIHVEKSGVVLKKKTTSDVAVPEEFQRRLDKNAALRSAYAALTPGRQRAYLYFIGGAKQSTTREARVEKCAPKILKGKGLDD